MLRLAGWLYGKVMDLRNSLYDRGVFKNHSLAARTISIGNITTGGTGKTPLVAHVAQILADAGERVCILTRGYGRKSTGRVLVSDGEMVLVDARIGGDEPVELSRKLIGKAIVIADADRVSAAAWAKEKFDVTVFVLDDAFQHRRAKRDLDIVCIDAMNPFGGGRMMPAGRLRESVNNLRRADAVVITRSDLVDDNVGLRAEIRKFIEPSVPIFLAKTELESIELADMGISVFAFCAIGNPVGFFETLRRKGYRLSGTKAFRDHHYYTQDDANLIEREARETGADALITTAKDMERLRVNFDMWFQHIDYTTKIDDEAGFRNLITSAS